MGYTKDVSFTMEVVKHGTMLFREAPFLEVFRPMLDGASSNLPQWKMSLPFAVDWNYMVCEPPFQPKLSSMTECSELTWIRP